jgi:hypothetical protein
MGGAGAKYQAVAGWLAIAGSRGRMRGGHWAVVDGNGRSRRRESNPLLVDGVSQTLRKYVGFPELHFSK